MEPFASGTSSVTNRVSTSLPARWWSARLPPAPMTSSSGCGATTRMRCLSTARSLTGMRWVTRWMRRRKRVAVRSKTLSKNVGRCIDPPRHILRPMRRATNACEDALRLTASGLPRMTPHRRTGEKAAIVATAVGCGALLVLTGIAGRAAHRAKAAISDVRRTLRERRHAERLAAAGMRVDPGPDVRLAVVEPVFDAGTGLAPGWLDYGWSAHDLTPGKPASVDLSGFGVLALSHPGLRHA